jgi:hypothetical protein
MLARPAITRWRWNGPNGPTLDVYDDILQLVLEILSTKLLHFFVI